VGTVWNILVQYREGLLAGLTVTLELCLIIWASGIVFGSLLGVLAARFPLAVGWPAKLSSFVLGGVPILVFLFWLHFPLQSLLEVVIDPFWSVMSSATL
jgi:ABC-type amino acid transport system permease subunit